MYNFLCQTVLIFPIYVLFTNRINTFWPGGIDIFCFWGISTCWFKNITPEKFIKFIKIFELYQVFLYNFLYENVPILPYCTLLTGTKNISLPFNTSQKKWLNFFFLIFWQHQFHHFAGCHATGINSSFIFF